METLAASDPVVKQKELLQTAHNLGSTISQYINEEETNRRLSRPVFEALKAAGFFRMYLPMSLGGLEADPVTVASVVEEVARYNTAAGWSLMVANSTTWWGGRLPKKGIEEIFSAGPNTFIAAAFHPPKKATRVQGGYMINGSGPLFSNVHESQWVFVTALVMENDQVKIENGFPEVIGAFMKTGDCEIIDTWHTLGMHATDSNDVAFNHVFVPEHLFFPLVPEFEPNTHYQSRLYQYSAAGIAITSLIAPVALAVARNAINEFKVLADRKTPLGSATPLRERGLVQRKLGEAEALVQSCRAYLYQEITDTWNRTVAGEKLPDKDKAGLLLAAAHTNQSCARAVDMMYSAAGSTGIYTRNKLAHYFSDAQVIRQHGFLNESRYESAAQIFLGLKTDLDVILF